MSDPKQDDFAQEMPTVTTLLKRKKLAAVPGGAEVSSPAPTPPKPEPSRTNLRAVGGPPQFRGKLIVEKIDFKTFEKRVSKHKKFADLKKLDCIGFLSAFFDEVTFYTASAQGFKGVLGFGTTLLVTKTAGFTINAQNLPVAAHLSGTGDCFAGPLMGLQPQDQSGLKTLGFQATNSVGVFPVMSKKTCTGIWVCAANKPVSFDAKQVKALKKLFSKISF